ncbi:MAG TPA: LysE family transporter [Bacteroidota bacterium]|nr:LysE family transporter [Bacteroidota bacterium]
MISAFAVGCIAGFLIAIPPGPVSVTTIARSIEHDRQTGLMVGLGAVVSETMYAALGFFGVKFIYAAGLEAPLQVVSFGIVTYMGARYAFLEQTVSLESVKKSPRGRNSLWLGLALSITTPTIGAAYFVVAGSVQSYALFESTAVNNVLASVGAGAGSLMWLLLLIAGVGKMRKSFGVESVRNIARMAGILLLIVGSYLGYAIVARY